MANVPLSERIKTIFDLAVSESFFITLFVIFLLTIIALVVNTKVKSRAPKYMTAIAYSGIAILLLARYGKYMLSLNLYDCNFYQILVLWIYRILCPLNGTICPYLLY